MNVYKQTCSVVANISLHAKAKQWRCMKLVGVYVQITFWMLYELSTNAWKWVLSAIMKPHDKIFFSYQFSQCPLESVWLALLCLGNDVNRILRLLLGSTKHYRSYRNNGFFAIFFIWQLNFWLYSISFLRLDDQSLIILTCIYTQ